MVVKKDKNKKIHVNQIETTTDLMFRDLIFNFSNEIHNFFIIQDNVKVKIQKTAFRTSLGIKLYPEEKNGEWKLAFVKKLEMEL